nr:probable L-type lectin-domain containing receptor kinase S.5 [Coffea arabica]
MSKFQSLTSMLKLLILGIILLHQQSFFLVQSFNFSFQSFVPGICDDSESRLICLGSVTATNGTLNLTPDESQQNPQQKNQIARVLFRYPVTAWPASFSTTFVLRILTNLTISGDGIAFVIAQDDKPSPPESFGSYIGILDPSTEGGILRQLAVELDTYKNELEPDNNHVAIVTTSVQYPIASKSLNSTGVYLRSGKDITVKIDYDGWEKDLQVSVAYSGNPLVNVLSQNIVLEDTVPQSTYVGFTASTAYFFETHQILSWNFTYYNLSRKSLKHGVKRNKPKIALSIVVPTLVVSTLVFFYIARKRRNERHQSKKSDMEMLARNAANAPRLFTYKQLFKATRHFNKENLLGAGGFGCVYKGVLLSDPPAIIAVKKINATSGQGEREYLAEICTIGRLRHKNLVQLQGWCHDKEQLFLVYEYMPNGSLDRYIGKVSLDWKTRHRILSGLASALLYLHEECGNPVVHRDVKPNNVMLDSEFNAHLGDFGLARLLQNDNFVNTMVAGTPGYLAPEVSYTGRATLESDVYSFGMVVLEVVCGRRSRGMMEENSLVDHVWTTHEKNKLFMCVDPTLEGKFDEEEVRRTILVGLACLHPDRLHRPRMRKVVQIFMNPDEPLMKIADSRPTAVSLPLHSSHSDSTASEFSSNKAPAGGRGSMDSLPDEITVVFDD